jgi:hypothetical protein
MAKEAKRPSKPRVRRKTRAEVTQGRIAERAYELYVTGAEGDALAHWLRAEGELRAA